MKVSAQEEYGLRCLLQLARLGEGEFLTLGQIEKGERILLEFVSANPTAVLVAASGRHAAYGDSLGRILEHHGHSVFREYYFNDAGGQVRRLGESVRARALGREPPDARPADGRRVRRPAGGR